MSLALSTAWNSSQYSLGQEIIAGIKKLGFQEVELNFSLSLSIINEIAELVKRGEINVISLHNFCPIPDGFTRENALPDCYAISSLNEEERKKAILQTKKTIDTARELNAKVVVLHCGRVEVSNFTPDLIQLYNNHAIESKKYKDLIERMINERRRSSKPYFEKTLKSLEELNRYAQEKNVSLGIENRFYYREIPSLEEIEEILSTFRSSNLFYWHDTGHAQVFENLGFGKHKDFLDRYANRMIGAHLHDVIGVSDHKAPSKGEINFAMLIDYIERETLKVIEAHYPVREEELAESKRYLEEIFDGKL